MQCPRCKAEVSENRLRCPKCAEWLNVTTNLTPVTGSKLLCDVVSSDIDRIATGPWDIVFGEDYKTGKTGIARSSCNLLAGLPGGGKSTLALEIADAVPEQTDAETLYLITEEPDDQVKARADRLGIKHQNRIRIVQCMTGEANVEDIIASFRPGIIILDSVQGIAGDSNMEMQVKVCNIIKVFCARYRVPAIITSHVNKSGEVAGLERLQHAVDAVITFFPEGEGENAPRVLHVEKNRNGKAFIAYPLLMTATGLVPYPGDDDEEEDDDDEDD